MKCPNCNTNINKNEKFCSNCGKNMISSTDKSLIIVSIVFGTLSLLGGFVFFPLPVIGLILALYQKEKSSEKTIAIILNTISIILFVILCIIIITFITLGFKYGKNIIDEYKEEYVEEFDDGYDIDGTWYTKEYMIKMKDNTYIKYERDVQSKGVFIVYDVSESDIGESKLNDIIKLVDGSVNEEELYYVVMTSSKQTNKDIWIKIENESKYFVYHLDSNSYEYLSDKEYE